METRFVLPSIGALTFVGKLVDLEVFSAHGFQSLGADCLSNDRHLSYTILVDDPIVTAKEVQDLQRQIIPVDQIISVEHNGATAGQRGCETPQAFLECTTVSQELRSSALYTSVYITEAFL